MSQLALRFPRSRRTDPRTSHLTAQAIGPVLPSHHQRILETLRECQPATYTEIASRSGMQPVAVGRRLAGMVRLELIVQLKETRDTPSGHPAFLYALPGELGHQGP